MKYAFSVLTTLIIATTAPAAHARTIYLFKDSDAISTIAQFMYDVAEDVPVSTRLTDKKVNVSDLSKCTDVTANDVLSDVKTSIKRVLRFYPDEEVPFDQAMTDLEDFLDHKDYKKCSFQNKSSQSQTKSTYYTDASDKIHLRLDNIALTAE
ncbi:MAG: hypothetical protein H7336_16250 [Bacteriovorax sp.]|nr:hypothetical protein [Bacteriovorax sp.]